MTVYQKRLELLRAQMRRKKTGMCIISHTDPHMGEYLPDHWCIIRWLTGFTGSAANVVVTEKFAGLWTDSRYYIQAEEQLKDSGVDLIRPDRAHYADFTDWIADNCSSGDRIGIDGRIFPLTKYRKLESVLRGRNIKIDHKQDLITTIWTDRPAMPFTEAFEHEIRFSGLPREEKMKKVRELMKTSDINYNLLTSPDDIMWLLNIRGHDIDSTPLLLSFALVGEDQVIMFTDERKIPYRMASSFDKAGVVVLPYEETSSVLSSLLSETVLLINPATTSVSVYKSIGKKVRVREGISIPARLKSVKNKTEIANISRLMERDGAALVKLFYWFEKNLGSIEMTELSISGKLNAFRSMNDSYMGPSFPTIVAFNDHSALPHYVPSSDTDCRITGNGILLIDSGGQYPDGTTDITRTIAVGRPSDEQKKDFTMVLKGMIALSLAKFPAGTRGIQLDTIARQHLWNAGLNYGHGTGHGVGYCLNVHEGPVSISTGSNADSMNIIEQGMVFSNEPAVYHEGEYGIRTENLILSYEDEETEFGSFLKFETLSLCYIDSKLIESELLDKNEIRWLNNYHSEVFTRLCPYLDVEEKEWLRSKCSTL